MAIRHHYHIVWYEGTGKEGKPTCISRPMTKQEACREASDVARKLHRMGYPTRQYSLSCCFTVLFPDGNRQSLYYEFCKGDVPGCELSNKRKIREANTPQKRREDREALIKARKMIDLLCVFIDAKGLGDDLAFFLQNQLTEGPILPPAPLTPPSHPSAHPDQ
jgi:hypothetical protein